MTYPPRETLVFSGRLQTEFAEVSGDWNPMHMDYSAARRTAAGRPLVHGMHTVLRALESLARWSPDLPVPSGLSARFLRPVYVGDSLDILQVAGNETQLRLQALVDGTTATDVHVTLGNSCGNRENLESDSFHDRRLTCRESSLAGMARRSGTIPVAATPDSIRAHFPNATRWLGVERISGLLCLSRLVGMECPGLHSLFSGFTIQCPQLGTPSLLEYQVTSVDDRFRLLKIDVSGLGIRGKVEAFARHPPVAQMSVNEASTLVTPGEFAGQRSLIVGGSRGLGELTAKLLAAGGGHPIITYAVGKDDAERVCAEIVQWGGHCDVLRYDVRAPAAQQLNSMTNNVSRFYYYATCPIFQRRTRRFDPGALDEFLDFYVRGFYEMCVALQEMAGHGIAAFYPSSVAVEDRPRDMTEYAMAKAAGEVLCADLNRFGAGTHIICVRLPRLLTDQTASYFPTQKANSADLILPIVRELQATQPWVDKATGSAVKGSEV